jgi:hypothetical protein
LIGSLLKEKPLGSFIQAFHKALDASGLQQIEISQGFGSALAVKDSKELVSYILCF